MVARKPDQPGTDERTATQVIGNPRDSCDRPDGLALRLLGCQVAEIEHREIQWRHRMQDLYGLAVDGVERGPPSLMAAEDLDERFVQGRNVQWTVLPNGDRFVVGQVGGPEE